VIITPNRANRPEDSPSNTAPCPFCPGNEHLTPEPTDAFTDGQHWSVRAVPNKFPALSCEEKAAEIPIPGGWRRLRGYGYHEVIIDSPSHQLSMGGLPESHVRKIVGMYLRRYRALSAADGKIRQVVLFRNHGRRAGTSLMHPHSQVVATPVVAPETRWRLSEEMQFFDATGQCGLCRVVERELAAELRIVYTTRYFTTLAPYAARVPYHLQIIPRHHRPTFAEIGPEELNDLSRHLARSLGAYRTRLGDPDYNMVVVSPPLDQVHRLANHWFVEILPRTTTPAGFELGSRIVVNIQTPEQAAVELRE
ncbi:MAG: DUF4931 domain-containing protein, partial [Deltaproteobacteria bacterium]|nr:DUF4931 domain-containing protein [Deltaproteobacteria bacterium]